MGRELRRVPLDFNWPLEKLWEGFINPHYKPCPKEDTECFNGWTAAGKWLDAIARLLALAGDDAHGPRGNGIHPHPYLQEWTQAPRMPLPRAVVTAFREAKTRADAQRILTEHHRRHPQTLLPLTPELATLVNGLTGRERSIFGSGGSEAYAITRNLIEAAGMPESWGTCQVCGGNCVDPDAQAAYEAWEKTPPPTGDGYQLWSTTTEGHPMSPVFDTLWKLCEWCAAHATTFGSEKATAQQWHDMLDEGFVRHEQTAPDGTKLVFI